MENPTLVFLTDRNDLDDQLFGQFQRCHGRGRSGSGGADRGRVYRACCPNRTDSKIIVPKVWAI